MFFSKIYQIFNVKDSLSKVFVGFVGCREINKTLEQCTTDQKLVRKVGRIKKKTKN